MLKPVAKSAVKQARGVRVAIVASKYNKRYVEGMLRETRAVLAAASAEVILVRVPGAFEIPVVAAKLAAGEPRVSCLICLGVILRGETTHAQHIGESVSFALSQIQITTCVPVIHEVLLLENEAQAKARCLNREHNRGAEAAYTALAMAEVMAKLDRSAGLQPKRRPFARRTRPLE